MAGGPPIHGRRRNQSGVHRVFRRQFPQFWIDVPNLMVIAIADETNEGFIKLMSLRMKTTRSVRRQTMTHVTTRDDGHAAMGGAGGGSDGFPQFNSARRPPDNSD